jgi:D-3-phosphoglycerate dehydrogenase
MDTRQVRILVAEKSSFSREGLQAFEQLGELHASDVAQAHLSQEVVGYDVLIVRLGLRVDASVLQAEPALAAIGTPTTGLDHIDLQAAGERGVEVLSLKGERLFLDQVYATAEHSLALMLALLRKIPAAQQSVLNYEWRRDIYRGNELNGKNLGLVGCGRLGAMMARYANGFGMNVYAFDPYLHSFPDGVEVCQSLKALLGCSDVVSLHVPLNLETTGMISRPQFDQMRPGAWLVNTSRGAIVDETALLRALESGQLAGAALDVLVSESQIDPGRPRALIEFARAHDNLIITPHIGGATYESVVKADLFLANKLKIFLETR